MNPTKLTPNHWSWDNPHPKNDWLAACLSDTPMVWLAELTDGAPTQSRLTSLLSPEERTRLERLRQREDQQRFLFGRGLLRIFAGAHLGLSPEHVKLNHGPFGKPFVVANPGAPTFQFNVSHSGKLILLAFHPLHEVGVDVEQVRPMADWDAVARRSFPDNEYRALATLPAKNQLPAFFQAWSRHEAGLKALGRGITGENNTAPHARLSFFDLLLPAGYQGTACVCSP